jgi:hypothetical protein
MSNRDNDPPIILSSERGEIGTGWMGEQLYEVSLLPAALQNNPALRRALERGMMTDVSFSHTDQPIGKCLHNVPLNQACGWCQVIDGLADVVQAIGVLTEAVRTQPPVTVTLNTEEQVEERSQKDIERAQRARFQQNKIPGRGE